jgi:hypothetical protein
VRSWKELEGKAFPFRHAVRNISKDGESHPVYDIYGSLKLGEDYHEVVPSPIEFGSCTDCFLDARVEGVIQASDSPSSFAGATLDVRCRLAVAVVRVLGDSASSHFPEPAVAATLAGRLLELNDYEQPQTEQGCTVLLARCLPVVTDGG